MTAASYYVDNISGDDANPGSPAQPFRTIRRALQGAGSGDDIFVGAGVYSVPAGEPSPTLVIPSGARLHGAGIVEIQ